MQIVRKSLTYPLVRWFYYTCCCIPLLLAGFDIFIFYKMFTAPPDPRNAVGGLIALGLLLTFNSIVLLIPALAGLVHLALVWTNGSILAQRKVLWSFLFPFSFGLAAPIFWRRHESNSQQTAVPTLATPHNFRY